MHRNTRTRHNAGSAPLPTAVKGLTVICLACIALRILSSAGADDASKKYVTGIMSDGHTASSILSFELGSLPPQSEKIGFAGQLIAAILPNTGNTSDATISSSDAPSSEGASPSTNQGDATISSSPSSVPSPTPENSGLYYDMDKQSVSKDEKTPTVITKPAAKTSIDAIAINNKAGYDIDTSAMLKAKMDIKLTADSPAILIIHTHSSEAYLPDKNNPYVASDAFRTQDKSQSIIRVGDELTDVFTKRGISVIHDRNVYDYPSYQGSYNRSFDAIQTYLKKYPSIKIVIDLHRDAIEAADGSVYKTIAQINNATCSQVMLVMGTDAAGLKHPYWRENLKLALHLQQEMNKLYPSLSKPIELSQYRYNQQAAKGSMIVEIGTTGNTLEESLAGARYFADAASNVILGLYR